MCQTILLASEHLRSLYYPHSILHAGMQRELNAAFKIMLGALRIAEKVTVKFLDPIPNCVAFLAD